MRYDADDGGGGISAGVLRDPEEADARKVGLWTDTPQVP